MLKDSAFGKNDIRGIYGDDITEELFYYTGRGLDIFIRRKVTIIRLFMGAETEITKL